MRYVLLLYGPDTPLSDMSEDEIAADLAGHEEFAAELERRGISIVGGEALYESSSATTVGGGDDGQTVLSDGPFAELKEQIGGFYVIEARDLDQAIEAARQCPTGGSVEVRPVYM